MPMDFDNLKDNIVISSLTSADSLNDYFKPVLSPDGCTLTLIPDNPAFVNLIKANTMDVTVSLSDKIFAVIEEKEYSLVQDSNSNFSVRYKPVVEKVKPTKNTFFVTRTPITLENAEGLSTDAKMSATFVPKTYNFDDDEEEKLKHLRNTTASKIYIYGNYFDEDSGVKTITVTENSEEPITYMVGYDYGNKAVFHTENGLTKFCIEYDVKSANGAVDISTVVYDAASNPAEENETLKIIKVSSDSFINDDQNERKTVITNVSKPWCFDGDEIWELTDRNGYFEPEYLSDQKKIRVGFKNESEGYYGPMQEKIYGYFYRTFTDLRAYCLYDGVQEPIEMNKGSDNSGQFYLTLNVASVNGLEGTIIIVDELLNNSTTLDFKFPSAPDVVYYGINDVSGNQILKAQSMAGYDYYLDTLSGGRTYIGYLESGELSEGNEYKLVPYNGSTNNKGNASIKLLGDIDTKSYTKSTSITLPSETKIQLDATTPYSTSTGETGMTNIQINLAPGSWDTFDSILVDYYDEDNYNSYQHGNSNSYTTYSFNRGDKIVIKEKTERLYNYNYYVDVYGISENKKTEESAQQKIAKFTDSSHDNVPPTAYLGHPSFDYYTFNMSDVGSSPKSAYLLLKSGEKLPVIEPGATEFENVQISAKTIEKLAKYDIDVYEDLWNNKTKCYYYYFEMEDVAGNSCTQKIHGIPVDENKGVKSVSKSSDKWVFSFDGNQKWIQINQFYKDSGNFWVMSSSVIEDLFTGVQSSTSYADTKVNNEKFVRVVTRNSSYGINHYSKPQYFYTGTQNTGTFDYMLEYSNTELLIASDAPVFVEIVATNKTYEECKTWTENDWIPDGKECRSFTIKHGSAERYTVLPLSSSNTGPAKYTIPLAEMDKRSSFDGYNCYVVIAHLANGKTLMSEVKQR